MSSCCDEIKYCFSLSVFSELAAFLERGTAVVLEPAPAIALFVLPVFVERDCPRLYFEGAVVCI